MDEPKIPKIIAYDRSAGVEACTVLVAIGLTRFFYGPMTAADVIGTGFMVLLVAQVLSYLRYRLSRWRALRWWNRPQTHAGGRIYTGPIQDEDQGS